MAEPTSVDHANQSPEPSAQGYRQLFESNPHPMMVLDRESLKFLAVNDAAMVQYGYSREEFLQLTPLDIRPTEDVDAAREVLRRDHPSGLDNVGVWRHRRKDGSIIFVELTSHPITWQGRSADVVLAHDVTERLAAERALRELNATLEQRVAEATAERTALFDALPDLVFRQTSDGTIVGFHAARHDELYVPPEQFMGKRFQDLLPPDAAAALAKAVRRVFTHGNVESAVYDLDMPERGHQTYEARIAPLNEDEVVVVVRNQTELRQTLDLLRQSESRYRGLVESQQDLIVRVDLHNRFTFVNDAYCRFFGKTREELLGNSFAPLVHDDDLPATLEAMKKLFEPPYRATMQQRAMAADGWRWLVWEDVGILDDAGQVVEIQAIGRDITEQKTGEQAVRQAEARFRAIFEQANVGIALGGPDDLLIHTNRALQRMLGYTAEELHGRMSFAALTHPDDVAASRKLYDQLMAGEIDSYRMDKRYCRKDGGVLWAQVSVSSISSPEGGRPHVISMIEDISERKQAEQALRISEQRFRAVFENSGLGVVLTDGEGRALLFNPALQQFLGYGPGDLDRPRVGEADFEMVTHPDDIEVTRGIYQSLASGGSDQAQLEKRYLRRDGQVVWGRVNFSAVRDEGGKLEFIVAIVEDITALKRADEMTRRHEAERAHFARLISMGEMAAGLAHQLNQPLTAVVNYTQGCVRRLQANTGDLPALIYAMNEAASQAQRAGQIVQHLRRFIQKQEPTRVPVDLNDLLGETVSMLAEMHARQRHIEIDMDLAEELPRVMADAVQIEQVILNLLNNGIEAISHAGVPRRVVAVTTRKSDDGHVEVVVSDSSGQAPTGDLEQMFEPFFTTKEDGMGMGLKVSRSIISAHGGRLWASVNPDRGLTFHFVLPAAVA